MEIRMTSSTRNTIVWGPRGAIAVLAMLVMLAAATGTALAQQPPQPDQDGYVAVIDADLMQEQLPAAPLLIAAYAVAWVAVFGYLWFIWQRLGRVERELAEVSRRIQPEARR
jgi:CcmD family protein